jgi:hypothetical protein
MVSDDELKRVVDAYRASDRNKAAAARALDMPINTFKDRLNAAVRRNLTADFFGGEVPEGYVIGNTTQHLKDPITKVQEWRRLWPIAGSEQVLQALEEWGNKAITPLPSTPVHMELDGNDYVHFRSQAVVYNIPDVHLGQYSWGKETGGSYDLDIAANTVRKTFARLVASSPAAEEAIVLGLGDYFHADGNDARTPKSGNALDVDSRFGKVQWVGAELLIEVVDMALQKHSHVTVKVLPGNHDPRAQDALTIALWFRYLGNPRVTVDRKPGMHWFYQWGKVMIAAHHGHETKAEQMPGVMASFEPAMWGSSLYRYAYLGHWHKRLRGTDELKGAVYEVFQAITAKDAWNRGVGHSSGRSITAIVLDKNKGEVMRVSEPISPD